MAAVLLAACGQENAVQSIPPPATLSVLAIVGDSGTHSVSLALNDTVRLAASAYDIFSHPVGTRVSFLSRNPLVASVSTQGLVQGLGNGVTYVLGYAAGGGNSTVADSVRVQVTVTCTLEARPGIVISVRDSITGSGGPFANVSYVARESATFRDSTVLGTVPGQIGGVQFAAGLVYERAGTYDVIVVATGYKPWVRLGVVVGRDACHVTTVNLTARLVQ
jgi:hypothetical protein